MCVFEVLTQETVFQCENKQKKNTIIINSMETTTLETG